MSQYLEDIKKAGLPLAQAVMSRFDEIDKQMGGLKDQHVKFLIAFVKLFFGTDHYVMEIDLVSVPHRTTISPLKYEKIPFRRIEWVRLWLKLQWWQRGGRTLSSFLKLGEWKIVFSRVPRKLDAKDEKVL
jgi:hypothetical protein